MAVRSATWEVTSWLGRESGTLRYVDGAYQAETIDIDDWRATAELKSAALPPSPRLATTVWPKVIATATSGSVKAIDVFGERMSAIDIGLQRGDDDGTDRTWKAQTAPPPMPPLAYRISSDGDLVDLTEPVIFGTRVLRAAR